MSAISQTLQLSLLHIEQRPSSESTVGHIFQTTNTGQTSANEPVDKACSHFTTSTLDIVSNTVLVGLLLSSYVLQIRAVIVDETVNGLSREAFILDVWWTTSQVFMTIASHIDPMPVLHCIASQHMSVFQAWGALLGVVQTVVVWLCSIITLYLMTTTPLHDNVKATVGSSDWLVHTILILWNVIPLGSLIASLPERLRRRPIDSDLNYEPSIVPMMFINPILGVLLPVMRARLQHYTLQAAARRSLSSFSPLICVSQVVAFGLLSASMYNRVKRTHPGWKIVIELQPYRWFEVGYMWGPYAICAAGQSWILVHYLSGSY